MWGWQQQHCRIQIGFMLEQHMQGFLHLHLAMLIHSSHHLLGCQMTPPFSFMGFTNRSAAGSFSFKEQIDLDILVDAAVFPPVLWLCVVSYRALIPWDKTILWKCH
jgi:hypothetical protein